MNIVYSDEEDFGEPQPKKRALKHKDKKSRKKRTSIEMDEKNEREKKETPRKLNKSKRRSSLELGNNEIPSTASVKLKPPAERETTPVAPTAEKYLNTPSSAEKPTVSTTSDKTSMQKRPLIEMDKKDGKKITKSTRKRKNSNRRSSLELGNNEIPSTASVNAGLKPTIEQISNDRETTPVAQSVETKRNMMSSAEKPTVSTSSRPNLPSSAEKPNPGEGNAKNDRNKVPSQCTKWKNERASGRDVFAKNDIANFLRDGLQVNWCDNGNWALGKSEQPSFYKNAKLPPLPSNYSRTAELVYLRELILFPPKAYHFLGIMAIWAKYFRTYVCSGMRPNPFQLKAIQEKEMKKILRRYVKHMIYEAYDDFASQNGWENGQEHPETYEKAYDQIQELNEDLIRSISIVGNMRDELVDSARENCLKFNVYPKYIVNLSEGRPENEECNIQSCTHEAAMFTILRGGKYDKKFKVQIPSDDMGEKQKIIGFCAFHHRLYDLIYRFAHMNYNIHKNIEHQLNNLNNSGQLNSQETSDITEILPDGFMTMLTLEYLGRYNLFWIFGKPDINRPLQLFEYRMNSYSHRTRHSDRLDH